MSEQNEIDLVKYGAMWQRVQDYERRFEDMNKKLDRMDNHITELMAMANKSKGGLWAGMAIASALGAVVTWVFSHMKG
jgi:flagellin-specific chaperone FliS